MDSKTKILKIIDELGECIDSEYNENIEVEDFGANASCAGLGEMLEDFLSEVGKQLDIKELVEMFKRPLSIDQIVAQINEHNLWNFEELKEVHSEEDCEREDKYIYKRIIFNHKPSNKNYCFTLQMSNDRNVDIHLEYDGQVEKKEVVTTQWI